MNLSLAHRLVAAAVALPLVATVAVGPAAASPPAQTSPAAAVSSVRTGPLAMAEGTLTFGTQPSSATTPDERSSFAWTATPGAAFDDHIAIRNYSEKPLELSVYANDAFNTDEGGFDLYAADREPVDLGTWVSMEPTTVTVPERGFTVLPFRLSVPAGATPGDHSGGIVASLRTYTTDAAGNRIALDQRVGTRIYVRVSGPLSAELEVVDITRSIKGIFGLRGDIAVSYTIRNSGNVRLAGTQAAGVSGLFVDVPGPDLDKVPELLPGSSYRVRTEVQDVPLAFLLKANVQVDPSALTVADAADDPPPFVRSAFVWVWSWILVLVGIIALAALLWWLNRKRRRRVDELDAAYARMASASAATAASSGATAGKRTDV